MQELEFTSPVPPSTNHYNSYRVVRKGKKSIVVSYPSKEYVKYKEEMIPYLKQLMTEHEMINEFKHYYLDIIIYFDRTDKDSTNYFKTLQDVGNGILYYDDVIIIGRVNRVYYTYNKDVPPRVECLLKPVDYIGIWDNKDQYNEFIEKCKTCRNYKDNKCKKLESYRLYKITDDLDFKNMICRKYKEKKN